MPRNIPGSVAARRSPSRTDPSRPLPSTTVVTRDVGPERGGRHRRAGRARTLQVLTSALAGGGLVAAHAATGGGLPRVDDLALQAFSSPAADASLTDAAAAAPSAHSGTARSLAEPPPPVDVDAIVDAANGAVGSAVTARDEARERARAVAREAREAARAADSARSSAGTAGAPSAGGPTGSTTCALGTAGMEGVAANVARAGEKLRCLFGVDSVLGIGSRGNASDHPRGKALDFMVDRATGDRLAAYAQQNRDELGISYIIWRQRIDTGSGWTTQEDRGGATANHMDHVHISFS